MNGNDFIAWVLRSPFHTLLSKGMMLITVTGKSTGKKYTLPVGYYVEGDSFWVLTSRNRTWWRNLRGDSSVELLLKRRKVHATAEIVSDETAVISRLADYLHHIPQAAGQMRVGMVNGSPNMDDLIRVAKDRLFVRIGLVEEV